jgi:hypothetical protein
MQVLKKILLAAVAPLAVLGSVALAGAGAANAAPLYMDTSVSVAGFSHVDAITSITATGTGDNQASPTTVVFTAPLSAFPAVHGPVTWALKTASGANALTWTFTPGTGTLVITGPPNAATSTPITVEATDAGGAAAFATVTITPGTGSTQTSVLSTDTVTLPSAATNNTTGNVDFFPAPAGTVTDTLSNEPAGVALTSDVSGVLAGTTAIPGTYHNLVVTAADANGATAVETFSILVTGHQVHVAVPALSHGHAVSIAPTRENVLFTLTGPATWVHFTIAGPGAINGHQGWVYATPGVNEGVYSGLEAHHGYAVFYTPVTGDLSTTPVPGSHGGYVFFVTDTNGLGLI